MKKNLSSHAAAAAAIRSELKTWFPSTKFRVTSDSFANGNSVHIRWVDGPPIGAVDLVVGKYQYGTFDGSTDCYNYDNRREDIPQAKYVSCTRGNSVAAIKALAAEISAKWAMGIDIAENACHGWYVNTEDADFRYKAEDLIYRELLERNEQATDTFRCKILGQIPSGMLLYRSTFRWGTCLGFRNIKGQFLFKIHLASYVEKILTGAELYDWLMDNWYPGRLDDRMYMENQMAELKAMPAPEGWVW